jgi:hypothetical protein
MHKPRRTPATSAPAQRRYEAGPAPVTLHVPASRGRLIRTPLSPIGRTRLLSDLAVEHPNPRDLIAPDAFNLAVLEAVLEIVNPHHATIMT